MKSKIRIELDNDNSPIIQVDYHPTDDVRDKLVKRFIEGFDNSILARVIFDFQDRGSPEAISFKIKPIPSNELQNTKELIEEILKVNV